MSGVASRAAEAAFVDLVTTSDSVSEAGPLDAVDGVAPAFVARPASTPEVADVLTAAAAHDLRVVVRGRGTKLAWGRPPDRVDLVLDLSRMATVLDHAAGDLVVAVQAGTGIDELQLAVAPARQRLAIDGGVRGASVGGTIATATSGPRRLVSGTVRDLLLGVTLVRIDGTVAHAGGRVVKNVAGYDLCKLMTGSFGTLAVVTEAIFRLHPLPIDARYLTVSVDSAAELAILAHRVGGSQVVPAGIEVDQPPGGPGTLSVLLEGSAEGVASRASAVSALLGGGSMATLLPPDWWGVYPWSTSGAGGGRATALKVTFAISALAEVLDVAAAAVADVQLRGSAGSGVLYGAIAAATDVDAVAETVAALRDVTGRRGGATVVLDATDQIKARLDTWGPVGGLDLMRRVKHQFDPDRRLAPGRFVGGI